MTKQTKKKWVIVLSIVFLLCTMELLSYFWDKQYPPWQRLKDEILINNVEIAENFDKFSLMRFNTNGKEDDCVKFEGIITGKTFDLKLTGKACKIQKKWVFYIQESEPEINHF